MSQETLKALLDKLQWAEGLSPRPPETGADSDGLWAVKWVQGAVAAGASRTTVEVKKGRLSLEAFGPIRLDPRQLAQQAVTGVEPRSPAERHWVMALRHLRTLKIIPTLMCRDDHTKLLVTIHPDGDLESVTERYDGGAGNFGLQVRLANKPKPWATPWQPELHSLFHRLRFCPIPVILAKQSLSQRPVYDDPATVMSWMEPALGGEAFLETTGNPKQVLSPRLVERAEGRDEIKRCSLVFNLSVVRPGDGLARVWWVKDGALVGPVRLVGPTGAAGIEIICAGDRSGSLSEWAARDAWTFFPDKLALSVARRLAGGLDSLIPQSAAQEGLTGQLLRQANAATGFRQWIPTKGRPSVALAGPFHASVKAFSLRTSLELWPG